MPELCREIETLGKGIGNANRYRVLEALMNGSASVGEVVKRVKLSQPAVSQHLKVLKGAGLVTDERCGQEVCYSINVAYMAGLLRKLAEGVSKRKKKRRGVFNT